MDNAPGYLVELLRARGEMNTILPEHPMMAAAASEIARLRADLAATNTQFAQSIEVGSKGVAEIERLRAENERLRGALRPFAKGDWSKQNPDAQIVMMLGHNPYDARDLCKLGDIHLASKLITNGECAK